MLIGADPLRVLCVARGPAAVWIDSEGLIAALRRVLAVPTMIDST